MAGRCSGKLVSAKFSSHLALATTYSFKTVFASAGGSRAATRLTSLHIRLQALASCWAWNCCQYCFSMSAQSCSSKQSYIAGLYAFSPIILASNWSTRTLDLLLVGYSSAEYSLPPSLKKTVSPSSWPVFGILGILGTLVLVDREAGRQLWRTLLAIYSGTVSFEAARRRQAGSRKSKQPKSLSPSSCLNSPKHSSSRMPSKMLLRTCSPTKMHSPRTSRNTRSCSFWLKVLSLIFFIYPDRSAQGFLLSRRASRVALWSCWTEALGNRALSLSTRRRRQPERGIERRLAIVVQFQAIIDSNWLSPPSLLQPTVLLPCLVRSATRTNLTASSSSLSSTPSGN